MLECLHVMMAGCSDATRCQAAPGPLAMPYIVHVSTPFSKKHSSLDVTLCGQISKGKHTMIRENGGVLSTQIFPRALPREFWKQKKFDPFPQRPWREIWEKIRGENPQFSRWFRLVWVAWAAWAACGEKFFIYS